MKMKHSITFALPLLCFLSVGIKAQEQKIQTQPQPQTQPQAPVQSSPLPRPDTYQIANIERYSAENKSVPSKLKKEKRVVFVGNSITEKWASCHPDWFKNNGYIGRGIKGQTSSQMLLRFHLDVVDLDADIVVINAGTNDVAENTGPYHPEFTLANIMSMAEIARANGIKVILSSVLPHDHFVWRPTVQDVTQKIDQLNLVIKAYADKNKIPFVDYNKEMRDSKGAMKEGLSSDGVHPYPDTYTIMEAIVKPFIDEQLKKKTSR